MVQVRRFCSIFPRPGAVVQRRYGGGCASGRSRGAKCGAVPQGRRLDLTARPGLTAMANRSKLNESRGTGA